MQGSQANKHLPIIMIRPFLYISLLLTIIFCHNNVYSASFENLPVDLVKKITSPDSNWTSFDDEIPPSSPVSLASLTSTSKELYKTTVPIFERLLNEEFQNNPTYLTALKNKTIHPSQYFRLYSCLCRTDTPIEMNNVWAQHGDSIRPIHTDSGMVFTIIADFNMTRFSNAPGSPFNSVSELRREVTKQTSLPSLMRNPVLKKYFNDEYPDEDRYTLTAMLVERAFRIMGDRDNVLYNWLNLGKNVSSFDCLGIGQKLGQKLCDIDRLKRKRLQYNYAAKALRRILRLISSKRSDKLYNYFFDVLAPRPVRAVTIEDNPRLPAYPCLWNLNYYDGISSTTLNWSRIIRMTNYQFMDKLEVPNQSRLRVQVFAERVPPTFASGRSDYRISFSVNAFVDGTWRPTSESGGFVSYEREMTVPELERRLRKVAIKLAGGEISDWGVVIISNGWIQIEKKNEEGDWERRWIRTLSVEDFESCISHM